VSAAGIAKVLGGARRSGRWWSCCCPAHDDHTPSLSLRDGERGLIVKCWAGYDARDVLAELRRLALLGDDWRSDRAPFPPVTARRGSNANRSDRISVAPVIRSDDREAEARDLAQRIAWARRIWNAAREARSSPVAAYLTGRGITISPPPCLR
jgi:putative DNA primase/helicase